MPDNSLGIGSPAAVVITMRLRDGSEREFSSWHARISTAAAGLAGFVSAEVSAVSESQGHPQWRIIERFRDLDAMRAWRHSDVFQSLIREADVLVDDANGAGLRVEETAEDRMDAAVTEVITTQVKPEKVDEYRQWAARIHQVEARFPGYCGGYLQPPVSAEQPYWTTMVRFATPQQLDGWLKSNERQELLREHDTLVSSWQSHHLPSAFSGWFPANETTGEAPPAWKESMVVMLVLFPIVMLELRLLHPLLAGLNPALAVFLEIALSVILTAWPFVPLAIRALKWWLMPARQRARWINPAGIALVAALYAVEIAALWHLLPA